MLFVICRYASGYYYVAPPDNKFPYVDDITRARHFDTYDEARRHKGEGEEVIEYNPVSESHGEK
jgi:hypothetical protein